MKKKKLALTDTPVGTLVNDRSIHKYMGCKSQLFVPGNPGMDVSMKM